MSGPKRNPDKLNTIGIVVVGVCSAVLVYVTIVALQAFYMDDTSEIQTMADYGGQDTQAKSFRTQQMMTLKAASTPNPAPQGPKQVQTFRIPIEYAIKKVVADAKVDPANLVPAIGRSDKPTVQPMFGRPKQLPGAATPTPDGAGSAAAPTEPPSVPMTPTGGQGPGGGNPTGTPTTNTPTAPPTTVPTTPTTAPKTPPANTGSAAKGNVR